MFVWRTERVVDNLTIAMLMPYSPLKLLLMYNSVLFKCWTSNTCNLIILIIIKLQLYTCPSRGLFSLLLIDFWCLYASMIHWVHLHKVTLWFFFSCNECQDQCKPHNSRQFMFSVVLQLIENSICWHFIVKISSVWLLTDSNCCPVSSKCFTKYMFCTL